MMRLLFLVNSLATGGTETKTVSLANEFFRNGRDVCLAYLQEPKTLLAEINNDIDAIFLKRRGKFSIRALLNLRRELIEREIKAVFCMNLYPLLYAAALKHFFGFRNLRVVLAINNTGFERKRDYWFMWIYGYLIRRTDAAIYGCKYQMKLWQDRYGLSNVPSFVIYNGVNTVVFDKENASMLLRKELGVSSGFVIGTVGRLSPEKNQVTLLEIAARLNSSDLCCDVIFVGTGPEREHLERHALSLGIRKRVHFLGQMNDVRDALAAMDIFVLPSLDETFSNAALEAMAMSLPVVLSDVGGASEMIVDGKNGYLFDLEETERLVSVIRELRNSAQLRARVGQRARETASTRFNISRMIDDYENVLENI